MPRVLNVPPGLLRATTRADGRAAEGVFSFVARGPDLATILERAYGRPGLCLKVFKAQATPLSEFCWSDETGVRLTDNTRAQNLFAMQGYAPRVYDVALVNGERWAQVTDYVEDDGRSFDRLACKADVMERYGVRSAGGDMNPHNWVGSQMVDFQAHFVPREQYEAGLIARAYTHAAWGSREEPYQGVWGLEMESQRDTASRVVAMGWDRMDFQGKTVLDVGCNLGAMCLEVDRRGALRAVGVDLLPVVEVAREVANWLGHWNVDYLGLHLPAQAGEIIPVSGVGSYDVLLCLSAKQVRPIPWAFGLCRELCFFEGHVPDRESTYRPALEEHFARVEFLGMTEDHGPRPLFRCWK